MRSIFVLFLALGAAAAPPPEWLGQIAGCQEQTGGAVPTFLCSTAEAPETATESVEKVFRANGMSPARSSDGIGTVLKARHEGVDALVKIRENGAGSAITIQLAPASDPVSITAPAGTVRTARGSYASGSTSKAPPAPVAWPGWLRSDPSLGQFPPPVTDGNRSRCLIVKFPRSISFVEEVRELLDYYSNLFQKNGFRPNIRMEKESSMLGSKHFFHASVTGTDGVREISVLYGRYNTRHSFDVTINVCPVF